LRPTTNSDTKGQTGVLPVRLPAGITAPTKLALATGARRTGRAITRFLTRTAARISPILLLLAVKAFVIGIYTVPSESMETTLMPGDRILAQRVALGEIQRGDVIVF